MFAKTNDAIIRGSAAASMKPKIHTNLLGKKGNEGVAASIKATGAKAAAVPKAPRVNMADSSVLTVKNKPKQMSNSAKDAAEHAAKAKAAATAKDAAKAKAKKDAAHKALLGHAKGLTGKLGGMVKEAGHKAMEAAVTGSGLQPVQGGIHASLRGHKLGTPSGRHDDR